MAPYRQSTFQRLVARWKATVCRARSKTPLCDPCASNTPQKLPSTMSHLPARALCSPAARAALRRVRTIRREWALRKGPPSARARDAPPKTVRLDRGGDRARSDAGAHFPTDFVVALPPRVRAAVLLRESKRDVRRVSRATAVPRPHLPSPRQSRRRPTT